MKRIFCAAVIVVAAAGATAGLATASGSTTKLQLDKTRVGTILVNTRGFTVYAFTRDGRNRDACASISGCLSVWPPVTTSGRVIAGKGVRSGLIGAIKLKGGVKQVTYAGHPLYTYIADGSPGQTFYINILQFRGRWPAVNAAGGEVK